MKKVITMNVNGREYEIAVAPNRTLTQVLREELGLLGTKEGCGIGDCGACTVILDGRPVNSCLVLAVQANGSQVATIEGVAEDQNLHPVQQAFVDHGAIQCGFCTPGMVLSAKSLLERNPHPTELEVREAISGNLCRCTGYQKIVEAVQAASRTMKKRGKTKG
ncbi:MAG: (2Fe-2S)-binding protein [Syntrophorhabdaceae bacterium]|nr:(2Fe-2S)-binding protein [Syntrophorhabdaceae bacterium]MDD5244301.1 (2Fe-2S)-binding protein [Syntrophorhabdaceae bacterium]